MGNDLQSGLYDSVNDDGDQRDRYKEYYTNATRRSCRICMLLITIGAIYIQAQTLTISLTN